MDYFNYKNDYLYVEDVALSELAEQYGTPAYIYSQATLTRHFHSFNQPFGQHAHLICFAVKACSNIAILKVLAGLGAGFDVVSGGELYRVLKAGGDPKKIVFSGVGKTTAEIIQALKLGIACLNVESEAELYRIESVAKELGVVAPVSLRVNPDVDAQTHPYISTGLKENKFGINEALALDIYKQHKKFTSLRFVGIDCHIGSQLTSLSPFMTALDKLLAILDACEQYGLNIEHLDLGGGLGVTYDNECPPEPNELVEAICQRMKGKKIKILLEPGRAIAANAGVMLTRVEYLKPHLDKHFAIVDAGMNDFIRPALYQSYQKVLPVEKNIEAESYLYDVVGPVCESGDFLVKDRILALSPNQLLAIKGAGAYGFSMSSNYNTRPRPPEILVSGSEAHLIRERETYDDLISKEHFVT